MIARVLVLLAVAAGPAFGPTTAASQYDVPFPPHKVIGNVYFVGTAGLSNYLITTPQGHILINSDLESTVPILRKNVEQLGFKFSEAGCEAGLSPRQRSDGPVHADQSRSCPRRQQSASPSR